MTLFIPTIARHICPSCGGYGYESHQLEEAVKHGDLYYDEYEYEYQCATCGEEVKPDESTRRPARWFSLAFYFADRLYGGPEEGGWYYWSGRRSDETLRVYENTPEQVEMATRYAQRFEDLDRKTARETGQYSMHFRLEVESLPVDYFPRRRPFYS